MERYLHQLIEDLMEAAKKTPEPGELWHTVDMDNPAEVEDMAYVEQFINGTPQKLSEIVGVEKIVFPPLSRLSDRQVALLCDAMTNLLEAYHFVPDFPEGLPARIRYDLLREHWDSEHVSVGAGEVHIEFCPYDCDTCPFPEEYCDCRRFDEEEEETTRRYGDWDDEELPF